MRQIEWATVRFIPANVTMSDPRGERAYFTWKAVIDGTQYGKVYQLEGSPKTLPSDQFKNWSRRALDDIDAICRMSPKQLSEELAKGTHAYATKESAA